MCSTTSWYRNSKSPLRMCSRFASVDVSRLSTQMTRCPWSSRWSQRCEPRKPAPPVTTEVGIGTILVTLPERREQDDVADRVAAGEHHRQPVDPEPEPAR